MTVVSRRLSKAFKNFFDSEKAGGVLLIICTAVSLAAANSAAGGATSGCGTRTWARSASSTESTTP